MGVLHLGKAALHPFSFSEDELPSLAFEPFEAAYPFRILPEHTFLVSPRQLVYNSFACRGEALLKGQERS